jgi:hypothetical protein
LWPEERIWLKTDALKGLGSMRHRDTRALFDKTQTVRQRRRSAEPRDMSFSSDKEQAEPGFYLLDMPFLPSSRQDRREEALVFPIDTGRIEEFAPLE